MFKTPEGCQIPNLGEIYDKYLGDIEYGSFLEIGAYDGITHSNTIELIKSGWAGVMYEPIKEYYKKLVQNMLPYPRVECINQAVVVGNNEHGTAQMSKNGEWSTLLQNPDVPPFVPEASEIEDVTCIHALDTRRAYSYTDVLVIDTEGNEGLILSALVMEMDCDFGLAIVELHEKSPEWMESESSRANVLFAHEAMSVNGYVPVHTDDINTIFVPKKKL